MNTQKWTNGLGLAVRGLAYLPMLIALLLSFVAMLGVSLFKLGKTSRRYTDYATERRASPRAPAAERRHAHESH